MKKSKRRVARTRLWVEELEPRLAMSTLGGVSPTVATTSSNWAGYAVQSNFDTPANNFFTAVTGSWTVPTVTGAAGTTAYSAIWVGLDGYTSDTVEQIGTEEDLINGVPTYYAWYEMYPRASVNVTRLSIHPNDTVTASVTYTAGSFSLRISDITTSQSFGTVQNMAAARRSSAEWIVEAPSDNSGTLNLANFGSTTIKNAAAIATVGGRPVTGTIDNSAWQNASMNMTGAGNSIIALTGALTDTSGKSSFNVIHSAPAVPPPTATHHYPWMLSPSEASAMQFVPPLTMPTTTPQQTFVPPLLGPTTNVTPVVNVINPTGPAGTSTPATIFFNGPRFADVPQMPAFPFRAFGAGDVGAPDVIPLIPQQRQQAPERNVAPAVIPPGPSSEEAPAPIPAPAEDASERGEVRTGGVGKALLAIIGMVGFMAIRRETEPTEQPRKRRLLDRTPR